jgi:hypothetical protein
MVNYFKTEMKHNSEIENTFSKNYKNYCDSLTSEMQGMKQEIADLAI